MLRPRSLVCLLCIGLLAVAPLSAAAQSVESIVDNMEATYNQQLETVDTYIVETNLYTSYNRKSEKAGTKAYESKTEMNEEGGASFAASTTPSTAYSLRFDRLKKHATYSGTETVNGTTTHVLNVDDPSKVSTEIGEGGAEKITYYVDAEQHVPIRLLMKSKGDGGGKSPKTSTVTVNLKDYRNVDGLTLPYRMEFQFEMDLTEKEKKQMAMMIKKLESMPEKDSERMKRMMGDQIDMMKQMLSGEPMVIEVQDVKVNTEIPAGVF